MSTATIERKTPICLACMWVMVDDGPLRCDVHPEGVPPEKLGATAGCEQMEVPPEWEPVRRLEESVW